MDIIKEILRQLKRIIAVHKLTLHLSMAFLLVDKNFQQVEKYLFFKIVYLSKFFCYIDHLKKWLREHRNHPYPSNQEKIELAKQSLITYDQVTTWFNNARAILRRHQAKLRYSFDNVNDDDNESLHENKNDLDCNHKISSKSKRKKNQTIIFKENIK